MINDNDTEIPITSSGKTIKLNNNDTPFKYLGITTAPNGDQTHPITTLQTICSVFANLLLQAPINERDA